MARGLQIVVKLGAVLIGQLFDRFDFQNDFVKANEVGLVRMLEKVALIAELQGSLGAKRNILQPQFNFEALLINRLYEAAALLLVQLETRAHDRVALLLVNYLHENPFFVSFVSFVVYFPRSISF